jgi:hypothetical protein
MVGESTSLTKLPFSITLRAYLVLAGLEAAVCAIALLVLPSDSHWNILFGYSLPRLAVLFFFCLVIISACLLGISKTYFLKTASLFEKFSRLTIAVRFLFIAASVATFTGLELLLGGLHVPDHLLAYYQRLRPLLIWITLISAQTVLLLSYLCKSGLSGEAYFTRAKDFIPAMENKWLGRSIVIIFLLLFTISIPRLVQEAQRADLAYHQGIPTIGDDSSYHLIATNLIHGFGYSERLSLPLESYHLNLETSKGQSLEESFDLSGPEDPKASFYRPPGFPFMLGITYGLFGNESITARLMLAACSWGTALLILLTGYALAGWIGALAGGLVGLYHLNYAPLINFERLMTEIPTGFWIALFCLLFVLFLKKNRLTLMVLSALSLSVVIFMRANFFTALPLVLVYLAILRQNIKRLALYTVIVIAPLIAWSAYASLTIHQFVFMTTQGANLFASSNNIDVLDGLGPDHSNRGEWNPGYVLENGHYVNTRHNLPGPGESGWGKGLRFWSENLTRLPELFYVKLQVGTWYDRGRSAWLSPEGLQQISIGLLLLAIGFRKPDRNRILLGSYPSWLALLLQFALAVGLFIVWNKNELWPVLLIWLLIGVIAILFPYGDIYQLPFVNPVWFLIFVASHLITTIVFYGVRFYLPIFTPLLFLGVFGVLFGLYELFRRNLPLAVFLLAIISATIIRFNIVPEIIAAL